MTFAAVSGLEVTGIEWQRDSISLGAPNSGQTPLVLPVRLQPQAMQQPSTARNLLGSKVFTHA
jgi:hypothetical protein